MVDHIIASHVGMNPLIGDGMVAGTLKCTLVPQGTLAEKIRAANYGLGGVLTPTGVGTPMEEELDELDRPKKVLEIEGKNIFWKCRSELTTHCAERLSVTSLATSDVIKRQRTSTM